MTEFLGNCATINWDNVVAELSSKEGQARTYNVDFYINKDGRFNEVIDLWKTAGYDKSGTVEWINFYPGKDFDQSIITEFEKFTNTSCARAWISKIRPGRYAPYHWDIDDHEEEYLKQGQLIRFTAHPCDPVSGQIFIVDDHIFHNEQKGNVYQWHNHRAWHAGGNCSFKSKFLFNFLGIKK